MVWLAQRPLRRFGFQRGMRICRPHALLVPSIPTLSLCPLKGWHQCLWSCFGARMGNKRWRNSLDNDCLVQMRLARGWSIVESGSAIKILSSMIPTSTLALWRSWWALTWWNCHVSLLPKRWVFSSSRRKGESFVWLWTAEGATAIFRSPYPLSWPQVKPWVASMQDRMNHSIWLQLTCRMHSTP